MKFSMPANDPYLSMKLRFVATKYAALVAGGRENLLGRREFQVPAHYRETSDREKKTKEMFSYLRFVNAEDSELMLLSGADDFKLEDIDPLSIRSEIKVLEQIRQAAKEQFSEFDQDLEHDLKLLASGSVTDNNVRNCIVMRRGEKQVLNWYINLADKCIPLLQMPWKDLKRATAKCYQSSSAFDHYIKEVVVPIVKRS